MSPAELPAGAAYGPGVQGVKPSMQGDLSPFYSVLLTLLDGPGPGWRDQRRPRSSSQLGEGMGSGGRPWARRWRWGLLAPWHWPGQTAQARRTDPRRGLGRSRAGGSRGGWLEKDMVGHSRIWISHLWVSAPWGARPLSWTWWSPPGSAGGGTRCLLQHCEPVSKRSPASAGTFTLHTLATCCSGP